MKAHEKVLGMGLLVGLVMALPAHAAVLDGLVAYWPLDDSGNAAVGGADLAVLPGGSVSFETDGAVVGGAAVTLGGSNGHAGLTKNPLGTDFGLTDALTISSWYRIDTVSSGGEKGSVHRESGGWGLGFYNPDDFNTFGWHFRWMGSLTNVAWGGYHGDDEGVKAHHTQGEGEWWHMIQTMDSSGHMEVWQAAIGDDDHGSRDQVHDAADYVSVDTAALTSSPWRVAFYENAGEGGQIRADEVAIWNRALSAEEIEEVFDMGKAGQSIIPEPATLGLLALGGLALVARRRR